MACVKGCSGRRTAHSGSNEGPRHPATPLTDRHTRVGSASGVFFAMELAHESQNLARPGRTKTPVPLDLAARAGPEKSESVRDSRIGRIMIHHVGWKGGRHGWQNPIRRIYVTAWYWRFYQVNPGAMWLAGLMSVRAG